LDLCGEPLYQRGYRVLTTAAPMKETLAAALLRRVGYEGEEPFADPLCGSGTLLVEAGLIATHTAPGLQRSFAVEKWPHLGERARTLLHGLREEAKAAVRVSPHPLFGRDRDEKALEAARRNTRAAGLSGCTVIEELDATLALPPLADPGLLLTNPPYGDRLSAGGQKGMKTFYFKLGEALTQWHGWRLGLFVGNEAFESAFHMKPARRTGYFNGPIACELYEYPPRH
jgi:putative N6-adenine-specific DNA methylase